MIGRLRAAENAALARGGESARDDFAVERETIDVRQQRDIVRANFDHVGVEEIGVVDAGPLALINRIAEMREHVALRLDDARIDVVPVEGDDAVHARLFEEASVGRGRHRAQPPRRRRLERE